MKTIILPLLASALADFIGCIAVLRATIKTSISRCLWLLLLVSSSLHAELTVYPAPQECYNKGQISTARYALRVKQGTGAWQTIPLYVF
jgi:hypothetical protein